MIKIVEHLKFRSISGETMLRPHTNSSQYYHVSSLVGFKWVQLDHFLTLDQNKPPDFTIVVYSVSHFSDEGPNSYLSCTPEPTHSEVKSRLILSY